LMSGRLLPRDLNPVLIPHTDAMQIIAVAVCVWGLWICIWARRTLAGNWSSSVTFKQDHELIRTGPYRFVRHPIYTGILLMVLAVVIAAGRLHCWLGLVLMAVGFWIKLSQEERLLLRHFPEAYPLYQKQVKALVPWVI
jgi:protein-S-isoprenylcysteine O-methyltransferase Ste14